MERNKSINRDDGKLLEQIANHQMMFASFMSDLGILHGKMGVVLFFFHYARLIGNSLFEDIAAEVLEEIFDEIHSETPIRFSCGLCGIGWGVEYLRQEGFIENDTDDVLWEIDRKVMELNPDKMVDTTFESGVAGIAAYVTARMCGRQSDKDIFEESYLQHLSVVCPLLPSRIYILQQIIQEDGVNAKEDTYSWKKGLKIMWNI